MIVLRVNPFSDWLFGIYGTKKYRFLIQCDYYEKKTQVTLSVMMCKIYEWTFIWILCRCVIPKSQIPPRRTVRLLIRWVVIILSMVFLETYYKVLICLQDTSTIYIYIYILFILLLNTEVVQIFEILTVGKQGLVHLIRRRQHIEHRKRLVKLIAWCIIWSKALP